MRLFFELTKSGIILFVLIAGMTGYALSHAAYEPWQLSHVLLTLATLYFLSAGSFALNQAQEWKIDRKMPRTESRPIPSGKISVFQACVLGFGFVLIGTLTGFVLSPLVGIIGLTTVVLYNGLYTLYWKKKWAFGAVPGAIPGAMPVVLGYAANTDQIWNIECLYVFLIMFLWQMPHFWALAIRFKDDYAKGGIPVLPVSLGLHATLFHIGLYVFVYCGLALVSPWFVAARFFYGIAVVPFALKVLHEFFKYYRSEGKSGWLSFFMWINVSMLVFLIAPVLDKWHLLLIHGAQQIR